MPLPPYRFGPEAPPSHSYLQAPVLKALLARNIRTVLDIGCGNGALAKAMADAGLAVAGIDPSESGIANARKLLPAARFVRAEVGGDPAQVPGGEFDAVVSTEVIEHLFLPRQLLDLAFARLRPGGFLLVTTPYHGYLKNLALALFNRWDSHWSPQWDGGHVKFWSHRTLADFLRRAGFEQVEFQGVGRLPFLWKSMLLIARKPDRAA